MSLYPGLAYEAEATSRVLAAAAFPGCPVGETERVDNNGAPFRFARTCPDAVVAGQTTLVSAYSPSVIVWLSARERFDIRVDGQVFQGGTAEWEAAAFADWDRVLERLTARGAHIVLVLPFHWTGDDPQECADEVAMWSPECTQPNLSTNTLREEYRRWAERHPRDVTVIEPDSVLCPANPCPARIDGVRLRSDRVHFTQQGARLAANRLINLVPSNVWSPR